MFKEFADDEEKIYQQLDEAKAKCASLREEESEDYPSACETAVKLRRDLEQLDWKMNAAMHKYVMEQADGSDGSWIDLQGLSLEFALHKAKKFLFACSADRDISEAEVVYSAGQQVARGPFVKGKILDFLQEPPAGLRAMTVEAQSETSAKIRFS